MDEKQLALLMRKYAPMVTAVVSGMLGRGHRRDVEEVTADVFYQFWRADKYDVSDVGVRNLLLTIARRQAINRLHAIARRREDVTDDEMLDAELCAAGLWDDEISAACDRELIRAVIDGLPPPDNDIFVRRYYYCQSVKEIARAIRRTPKFVENRLYLAKKTVRERLLAAGFGHMWAKPAPDERKENDCDFT
ncbi:MAG: sigma-70 family RNA polymerase sigma factor [Clostridia bacterium]|nr:sigma-70 family RNA polymerase sigma factor [Clostridia bacterium]